MSDLGELVLGALDDAMTDTPQPTYREKGGLSMSALGGCRRKGAYLLAHSIASDDGDEGDSRAAEVGTALHAQWLPLLAKLLGGSCEVETWLTVGDVAVPGTVDLLLHDAVVDLKTVGGRSFDLLTQPRRTWVSQVTAGAMAMGVTDCAVLAVNRDDGRAKWWQWQVQDHADDVYRWIGDADHDPETVPRDYRGPGIDRECDWCPFAWTCWPEQPNGARPQAVLIHDDADRAQALAEYVDAAAREKRATSDKQWARDRLTGSEPGRYGSYLLRWRKSAGREDLDKAEARRLLGELGLPIPIKVGPASTAIDVRPAPAEPVADADGVIA